MLRIIPFRKQQMFLNPEGAAEEIMCELHRRGKPMRLCSFVEEDDETMLLIADDGETEDDFGYVLSPFPETTENDIPWTVQQRYAAGFDTLAVFRIYGKRWGLFRCSGEMFEKMRRKRLKRSRQGTDGVEGKY